MKHFKPGILTDKIKVRSDPTPPPPPPPPPCIDTPITCLCVSLVGTCHAM